MSDEKFNSRLKGFFRMSMSDRQQKIKELCQLSQEDLDYLTQELVSN